MRCSNKISNRQLDIYFWKVVKGFPRAILEITNKLFMLVSYYPLFTIIAYVVAVGLKY